MAQKFIGYNDDVIRPLCIKLPQITGYARSFESNMVMSFKFNDDKYGNQIWKKVESLLKIKFDNEPVYGDYDKYIKTKNKKGHQKKKYHTSVYHQ